MKHEKQVELVTIELQQNSRPFVTESKIKLRTDHELWFKENLINIAVRHLPKKWEYMAWVDSDLEFQNKDWVRETLEQLQTYKVVQLFSHCLDLGIKHEALQVHTGIFYAYCNGEIYNPPTKYGNYFHVGYAYAITRQAYDNIGGLLDFPILGSADNHMALAFIGSVDLSLNKNLHPNYRLLCNIFQERCEKNIKRNVGYVHGTILHHFHGNKVDRKYQSRWQILIENKFDPLVDIYKDSNGLWQLNDNKPKLRDDIIRYFRERNEDCNTMPMDYKYCKGKWI
jgi:Pyruvate/2-oxoacid:ferredoxin oxidoreductase delta subunit